MELCLDPGPYECQASVCIQIFESYHQGAFWRENILTNHVLDWSCWWRNYWRLLMWCCLIQCLLCSCSTGSQEHSLTQLFGHFTFGSCPLIWKLLMTVQFEAKKCERKKLNSRSDCLISTFSTRGRMKLSATCQEFPSQVPGFCRCTPFPLHWLDMFSDINSTQRLSPFSKVLQPQTGGR